VKVEYVLTLQDYKAALKLHTHRKLSRRISNFVFLWLAPLLALLSLLVFVSVPLLTSAHVVYENGSLWTFGFVIFCFLVPTLHFKKVRKQFNLLFPPGVKEKNVSVDIDDERVISAIPGSSEGKFFWNAILEFAQNEKITLFYVAKTRFLFVPTAAFSPSQRAELDDLVSRYVTKRSS
jgi:hypothetical protein